MLYNELRPKKLSELVGQEVIKKTLGESLRSNNVPHSMLFVGVRGTGKTTTARIVAKGLNCLEPFDGEPCGCCKNCTQIANEASFDVQEMDAAANRGVDDMNHLLESVHTVPLMKKKVFIIDEVHMLTKEASNRLLKVLEEPPVNVHFILCTTELQKVLPTIRSRCAMFNFKAIDEVTIATELSKVCDMKGISYDLPALYVLARAARGSMRDSLSLLEPLLEKNEQLSIELVNDALGLMDDTVILEFIRAVVMKDITLIREYLDDMVETGRGVDMIIDAFLSILIDILSVKLADGNTESIINTAHYKDEILKISDYIDIDVIIPLIEGIKNVRNNIAKDNNPKIGLLCEILSFVNQERNVNEVAELKKEVHELKLMLQNNTVNTALPKEAIQEKPVENSDIEMDDKFTYLESIAQEITEPNIEPVVSNDTVARTDESSYENILNSMWASANANNTIAQPDDFIPINQDGTNPFCDTDKKDVTENNVAANSNTSNTDTSSSSDMMEVFRNSGLTLDEPVYISSESEKEKENKVLSNPEKEKEDFSPSTATVERTEKVEKVTEKHGQEDEPVDNDNVSDTVSLNNMPSFLGGSSFGTGSNSFFNFFKH